MRTLTDHVYVTFIVERLLGAYIMAANALILLCDTWAARRLVSNLYEYTSSPYWESNQ